MSESFKRKLEEEFESIRYQIFFEQNVEDGWYTTPYDGSRMKPWRRTADDDPRGTFQGPPGARPDLGPTVKPSGTGIRPNNDQNPDDQGTIPVDNIPGWLQDYIDGVFPNGLPDGYTIHIYITLGETWYAIVGPDGRVIRYIIRLQDGTPWGIPPGSFVYGYDSNGVPLIWIPGTNGWPGGIYHGGGEWVEFLPGTFPGVSFPVRRGANGLWYWQQGGEWVPWEPGQPAGYNEPDSQGGIEGWWNGLPDWMKAVIIAAVIAGAAWVGAEIANWINGNEHVNTEGGGPPVPPGGDGSNEGGGGEEGGGGGGDDDDNDAEPPGGGGGGPGGP